IGGAKAKITVSGCTDAGSYTIDPDCTFAEGKESNYFISYTNNTLEILSAPLTIKASDSKPYDGTPLDGSDLEVTTEGLAEGEEITVTADGTITNAGTLEIGTEEIPYIIDWGSVNKDNYSVTEQPGTLTVTPADLTIKASGSKPYDGTPLIGQDVVTIDGLAERDRASFKVTATGTITDIGEADNPYTIDWGTVEQGNYSFTEETEEKGTLTVEKATLTLSLSYTGYEATDTSLRLYNFALTVTSNSAVEPVVVSEGNTWPSPYYSVILYDGTFPVYYSGDSCRWKVTVPGDTFSVSVFCSGTDGSYIELFCSCIGEINNYLITRNNPRIIIGNRTTESSDSDSSDTSDSTDMSTLSSTKKDRKIAADIDEKKDDAIKEEPEKNSEDTKETDAVDNPEKEAILEEAVDPAEESGNGTEPEDGMTEKGAEAEKTDGESDKEDTPSKEDAAVSEEKTDPASDGTEKDKEKTAADKDSSEKPDTGNISADEKKPESGSDTRSVGRDDPAESTGTIGDAIVNAGAQAGSAVVSAVETVGENTVNRVSAAESDGGQTEGDT
nr:hypothetical protein [Eubacterium sp.]